MTFWSHRTEQQARSLAYCLSLFVPTEKGVLKLHENFSCYQDKLLDEVILKYILIYLNKAKKIGKTEIKVWCCAFSLVWPLLISFFPSTCTLFGYPMPKYTFFFDINHNDTITLLTVVNPLFCGQSVEICKHLFIQGTFSCSPVSTFFGFQCTEIGKLITIRKYV